MYELDIPFQEIMHPFDQQSDWNDYRKLNDSGLVPCLIDDEQRVLELIGYR